ncbi:MAG: hypothetical protein FK734_14285 [Asgard group archaeon]|nr:hypothetical protein [Asgard group archaeon]
MKGEPRKIKWRFFPFLVLGFVAVIVAILALTVFHIPFLFSASLTIALPAFFFGLDKFLADNDKALWDNIVEMIASFIISIRRFFNKEERKKRREKRRKDSVKYLAKKVRKLPKEALCQISKKTLQKPDEALQCPKCQAYFDKNYLGSWLKEKNNCPVCKAVLKKTRGKRR